MLDEPEPAPEHVIVRVILWMSLPLSAAPAPLKTITPTRDFAAVVLGLVPEGAIAPKEETAELLEIFESDSK